MWSNILCLLLAAAFAAAGQPPDHAPLERGVQLFSEGRFSEAEPALREAVTGQPDSFDARFVLGATLAQLKRPAEAIEQLKVAHRLKPEHRDALKLLAAQYMIERQYAKAIAVLSSPGDRDEEVYLLLIESYQASGDTPSSFAMAQEAVKRFPSSARINCWMGFQLQFSGRYEDARGYLEKAVRLDPDNPAGWYILGEVFLKQQKARESIPCFEKAIELDPNDMDARIGLSEAWADAGDIPKALGILQTAEKSHPENPRVHLLLSRLWFRMGNEARAQDEAELSLRYRNNETATSSVPTALHADR